MELTIDSKPCDLAGEPITVGGYAAAELADVEAAREGRSQEFTLPATPRNEALLGFARDPHTSGRFNASLHRAVLSAEGAKLLAGTVRLLKVSDEGYRIEIREGGARWAKNAARRVFSALGIDYHARLLPSTVSASWTDDSPVKFFPIRRDEYPQQNSPSDLLPAERILSVDDYHPFLHVATLVETIFAEAGYRIESNFTSSPEFRSLYMSGAYPSRDTAALAARMGFYARRLAPATAQGNHLGRVSANPSTTANSVGNIVETATPQTLDTDGEPIPELCNNGNCFRVRQGRIVFTPTTEVSAGFEYYLKYTTDHRILTRERLRGFDSVYLGTGADMPFTLANRYEDRRPDISPGHRYLAIVFDHTDGAQYRLAYTKDGVAEALWTEFSARTAQVTTPASGTVADPVLLIRSGTRWVRYAGDWALYDGYVTESGRTTVELRVRTAPERIAPASPKFFDRIYFYGAEGGNVAHAPQGVFTPTAVLVGTGLRLRNHFRRRRPASYPAVGTARSAATPLQPEVPHRGGDQDRPHRTRRRIFRQRNHGRLARQERFLAACGAGRHRPRNTRKPHMGLPGRRRRREPFQCRSQEPLRGVERPHRFLCRTRGRPSIAQPLFRPTLSEAGHYANAPSAQIMQVGDRDDVQEDGTNFTPRIVRFAGLHPLPAGERWGYPSGLAEYPLAAFHFTGTQRRRASRSVSKTATASAACTIATTVRQHRKPPASASPSRCGSRRTNSKASSRPAPGCPTCVRYSGSTPGARKSAPRSML